MAFYTAVRPCSIGKYSNKHDSLKWKDFELYRNENQTLKCAITFRNVKSTYLANEVGTIEFIGTF